MADFEKYRTVFFSPHDGGGVKEYRATERGARSLAWRRTEEHLEAHPHHKEGGVYVVDIYKQRRPRERGESHSSWELIDTYEFQWLNGQVTRTDRELARRRNHPLQTEGRG